jgi:arylsulfatase A-like enzyme
LRIKLVRQLAHAVVSTWVVAAAELMAVGLLCRAHVSSVWELQYGLLWLSPTVMVAGLAAGLGGGALLIVVEHAPLRAGRSVLGGAGALFGGLVGWGVGGGRHLAALPARGGFALALAALAGAAMLLAFRPLRQAISRSPVRVAMAVSLVIVALELVNRFALVRLYPALHLGLAVATTLSAAALPLALRSGSAPSVEHAGWRRWLGPVGVGAAGLVALAAARPAAARLAYFDNFRLLLLEQAPLLGQAVRAAALLSPPASPPASEPCVGDRALDCPAAYGQTSGGPRALDLRGRDLLLVTIDAVRADHVGAYGYGRPTTPNLDALARQGAVFEYAYCPTPHTSYSIASLMTGKYMRPLLLQGAGEDSDTWAGLLRTYGYRTAAFYPPAVFFIDANRFVALRDRYLDFEYRKVEFLEGQGRVEQVVAYLRSQPADRRLFVWVHLFGPHEPYQAHSGHDFGDRDVDRYDAEIAAADATTGAIVRAFRERRPGGVVIASADHGEEFGEHGGRYHGTTVYEEQVRVPLIVTAAGAVKPGRFAEPVQTIDLMPTVLAALSIPVSPRVRGRDLGPLLARARPEQPGLALAETEEQTLLARGTLRLVCERRIGACRLFDVAHDPRQLQDLSARKSERFAELRTLSRAMSASHGRYEVRGLRAEGKRWPEPILRGRAGDAEAARDIAALLDDADLEIRRKAAELLFELRREETAPALRLALGRDEDQIVRSWAALALTRLGQGAPLAFELAKSSAPVWRRLAALALAEVGDARGRAELVAWWKDVAGRDYGRSRQLLDAFARIRSKEAVWPLVESLGDVRLRPHIASTLAAIGEDVARGPLARALSTERYQNARAAITRALVELGAHEELAGPLTRFLGVPDPLPDGLGFALEAGVLEHIGGPTERQLAALARHGDLGVAMDLVVPRGGNGSGVRALFLARTNGQSAGQIVLGRQLVAVRYDAEGKLVRPRQIPRIDPDRALKISLPNTSVPKQVYATLPESMQIRPGQSARVVVFADRYVEIQALALLPLADELPPPAPQPWQSEPGEGTEAAAGADPARHTR